MSEKSCMTCEYLLHNKMESFGVHGHVSVNDFQCRRYPPTWKVHTEQRGLAQSDTKFPYINNPEITLCGEYKEKPI